MKITMKRLPLSTILQIENFLKSTKDEGVKWEIELTKDKYEFIKTTLYWTKYNNLKRGDKHTVLTYLKFLTSYSKTNLKNCVKKWRAGRLFYNPIKKRNKFSKKYFPSDIALLIKTDVAHECLSGEATKRILVREFKEFKKINYGNISNISAAHIYNIRKNNLQYKSSEAKFFKRTQAVQVNIGVRRKPEPNGKPGYLRVDTVHQGDFCGKKGVYHINIVDEITQYEMIGTVEKISEQYLRPVIEELLKLFPFTIYEFHADNGSEFINKVVVELLNKIHIELTKSRSRHSNDNALVESKNGSIIRKFYGRNYIDEKWAKEINEFNKKYLNIYLNYHRPCAYARNEIDEKGKIRKKYKEWETPYEKFKNLPDAEKYLKGNFNFEELEKIAKEKSDNEFAEEMQKAKSKLFKRILKR